MRSSASERQMARSVQMWHVLRNTTISSRNDLTPLRLQARIAHINEKRLITGCDQENDFLPAEASVL